MVLKFVWIAFFLRAILQTCQGSKVYTMGKMDPAANQLMEQFQNNPIPKNATTSAGAPVYKQGVTMTVGKYGPIVMQDSVFIDIFQHFDRERIPERVVHAKGAGAWGYFTVTNSEITKYCDAAIFSKVGKVTNLFARFSTVAGERGSADTVPGFKGFAIKFYTEKGNWDLLTFSQKAFFIRDPLLFPSLTHAAKRNPVTHLSDPAMLWDFLSNTPSTVLASMLSNSAGGLPLSYRYMNGYAINTFVLTNAKKEVFFCKFILETQQGLKNMDREDATRLAGEDPDYYVRDLYDAIALGDFPSWVLFVQIMTPAQAHNFPWNPFDDTKFWPIEQVPPMRVGVVTLSKNPINFFADVEQVAFNPAVVPPGISPSDDKVLQGRLFSYGDAAQYRLNSNFDMLRVNQPLGAPPVANLQRDGRGMTGDNQDGAPNYFPSSYHGPWPNPHGAEVPYYVSGNVTRFNTMNEDNFSQATLYWKSITQGERDIIVTNIAGSLGMAPEFTQRKAIHNFWQVSPDFGSALRRAIAEKKLIK